MVGNQRDIGLFSEKRDGGNGNREQQLEELLEFIRVAQGNADKSRAEFFKPNFVSMEAFH